MTRSWLLLPGLGDGGVTLSPLAEELRVRGDGVAVAELSGEAARLEGGLLEGLTVGLEARLGPSTIVVGHSAGGLVGLLLAERPGLVGLALIEGSLRPTDEAVVSGFLDGGEVDSGRQRLLLALADRRTEHERLYRASVLATAPALFSRLAREVVERRRGGRRLGSRERLSDCQAANGTDLRYA